MMNHEQSLQNRVRVPQRRSRHQLSAEVLRGIAFGRASDENVWRRANLVHRSQLRLARESFQNKAPANPAFLLGPLADELTSSGSILPFQCKWVSTRISARIVLDPKQETGKNEPRNASLPLRTHSSTFRKPNVSGLAR